MIPHLGFRVRVHYHDSMCSGLSVFIVCLQMWETLNPTSNSSSLRACLEPLPSHRRARRAAGAAGAVTTRRHPRRRRPMPP